MKRQIVNFINFIRGNEPRFEIDLFETVKGHIDLLTKYGFKGTFLLQYDALINPEYTDMLKALPSDQFEIGVWFEIPQPLVENSNVPWRGCVPWDCRANVGFSVGYENDQKKAMVDELFEKFKEIFGYYPKSFGSWAFDIVALNHANEKYGLDAACNCKDQVGTDGYTMWGGYYGQAYYPSKVNSYCPAQNEENQVKVPIFRMLGSDYIYQYDFGYNVNNTGNSGIMGVVSLEPGYTSKVLGGGGVREWNEWYFDQNFSGNCLSFGYTQAGQENDFFWKQINPGLYSQCEIIKKMVEEGRLEVETLGETGRWYKETYPVTPASSLVADHDWKNSGKKTWWYCCKNYRVNFYAENGKFWIRDLYIFDEKYEERYLNNVCTTEYLEYDTLPVMDGVRFCGNGKRAGIYLKAKADGTDKGLDFYDIRYSEDGTSASLDVVYTPVGNVRIVASEDGIKVTATEKDFVIEPVYADFTDKYVTAKKANDHRADLTAQGFGYGIDVLCGTLGDDFTVASENKTIEVKL